MESIILYGGSFDPIHSGHIRIAKAASLMLNADVVFIPAKAPRFKTVTTSQEDRINMLRLALKEDGSSAFSISYCELEREGEQTKTVDTVHYFKKKYPKHRIYLLIGADQVNSFHQWIEADEIARLVTPLYVTRSGVSLSDENLARFHMQRLAYDKAGPVSSTAIRSLRSADMPLSVRKYIEDHRLYGVGELAKMISPHRLAHSISVANLAYEIARSNNLPDYQSAYLAGILHDCAKKLDAIEGKKLMEEHFPEYVSLPDWTYHQFLGSHLARTQFGVADEGILDAISFHATGKAHMTPIGKIIYASDKIDPLRAYDSSKLISKCIKNYHEGFVTVLRANRAYLTENGYKVDNPLTEACMKQYLGRK